MCLKVLIADDDFGMRLVLKKIIEKIEGFEVVAEVEDGNKTLHFIEENDIDVAFLDIEMPLRDGLECAKIITDIDPKTIIIFATAHVEYMPEAFEVYAFDYLMKPFKVDRIKKTLMRIKEIALKQDEEDIHTPVFQQRGFEKLVVKNKEGINFIDTENIVLIQREDRSTVIYSIDNRYITSEGLGDLEKRLEKTTFFRSHKSYIINISRITKISPYGRWTYIINFKNYDKDALITHKKFAELEKVFGL